jgi:hypothetical protein
MILNRQNARHVSDADGGELLSCCRIQRIHQLDGVGSPAQSRPADIEQILIRVV